MKHLRQARSVGDLGSMLHLLRSGLLRNLGGLCDLKLFRRSLLGTKHSIEDYVEEVVSQLAHIAHLPAGEFSDQAKIEFFTDTKQAFGNTALLLSGGATFGLYHLGVVKCLFQHNLLPRIISGTSVGALIAALVCTNTDEELPKVFSPNGINLQAFARVSTAGSLKRKMMRLIQHGYLMDVTVLEDCVRSNVGDITFEEAYKRTRRILNIVVLSARKHEVPRLLNYLTAPNVLIRSAACASCAITGLYDTVPLLAKDHTGSIVPWNPEATVWSDASLDSESPIIRLAELFNVNHLVCSQANPYLLPFTARTAMPTDQHGMLSTIMSLVSSEVKHRLYQLRELGILPSWVMTGMSPESSSAYTGNVSISPDIAFTDYHILFSNPTSATLDHWMLKGEQATWPLLSLIYNRCAIELELDRSLLALRSSTRRNQELAMIRKSKS